MSQSTGAGKKKAEKKGDSHAMEQVKVQQFVFKEQELEHRVFEVDVEMKHSQFRTVNATHEVNLMQKFRNSPPRMLELATVPGQGMFPVLWQWCMCMPFHCMRMVWECMHWDWSTNGEACLLLTAFAQSRDCE